jgi:glycerol-3-phosphate acyltransferase PlsY
MFAMSVAVVGAIVLAYLAGSVPTGFLVARARGVDIRAAGSGNIGATNVARTLGRPLGALVLFLDALKGFAPTLGAAALGLSDGAVAASGLATVLGHVFPVWLRFRGGKGVATGLGVFLALAPVAAAAAVVTYAGLLAATRVSSLGSLAAATVLLGAMVATQRPGATLALGVAVWLLIVWRHRDNIARLRRGQEGRL